MKPRGLLMIEHRLIEKVLAVVRTEAEAVSKENYEPAFVEQVVDFIKTYADRTHHGKEEDLLFKELEKKRMDSKVERQMSDLIEEHKQARAKVKELVALNDEYKKGKESVLSEIKEILLWLVSFYPVHIEKEDAVFFPASEKYFTPAELDALLSRFLDFDRKMIHEKYEKVYEEIKRHDSRRPDRSGT